MTYLFSYVHSIAYALERLGDRAGIPILARLLANPQLHDRLLPRGSDPRDAADYIGERCAYLEMNLARALARRGGAQGYEILISYTTDQRMFLARSAMRELEELTGKELGFDVEAWRRWLKERSGSLVPIPFTRKID